MDIIEAKGLTHRFADGTCGVRDLDLTVAQGEFVVAAGRNGSGKTTFFRHLNGLLLPTSGRISIGGISVADDVPRARRMTGMVFQDADSQIIGETVYEDAAFGPENLGLDREEIRNRAMDALRAVGLEHMADQKPGRLSGGEKRRLAVAGVLAMHPEIIVFDEPFSNLDYPGVKQVLAQILALRRDGRTILLSTHDLEKVLAHADRLVIMSRGRVVRDGRPMDAVRDVEAFGVRAPCATKTGQGATSWLN